MGARASWIGTALVLTSFASLAAPLAKPLCDGDYADAIPAELAVRGSDAIKDGFVFAIRNTATYEHVFYGRDGKLRRAYLSSVIHGTGFAYRRQGGDTLLVTNEHIAAQPEVTDDEHKVEGIPRGAKKVREQLRIVRSEDDDYEPGHVPLQKVFTDSAADVAVLRTRKELPLMPYRFGRSAALRAGNVVQVRGFPLGVFPAQNSGKVTNAYTEDSEKGWTHVDVMIDALLNGGGSGSPVFAISCKSGEPELVGVYHAGYSDAAALNAVVAIDQLREELETLRAPKRDPAGRADVTGADRERIVRDLATEPTRGLLFPFGGRSVQVKLVDRGTLRFAVLDEDFPLSTREPLALVDRVQTGFGTLDEILIGSDGAQRPQPITALEPEVREHFERLYDALWHQLLGVVDYRQRLVRGRSNADAFSEARALRSRLRRRSAEQKELLNVCAFEADRATLVTERPLAASADAPPATAPDAAPPEEDTAEEPEPATAPPPPSAAPDGAQASAPKVASPHR
jgi:serine protease Do